MNFAEIQDKIIKIISRHLDSNDLNHTLGVVQEVKRLIKEEKITKKESEILVLAAYLHDYTKRDGSIKKHHLTGSKFSAEILKQLSYPYFQEVSTVIITHSCLIRKFYDPEIFNQKPTTKLQLLLIKADMLEQVKLKGLIRIFLNNWKKGLDYIEHFRDIKQSYFESKQILKETSQKLIVITANKR